MFIAEFLFINEANFIWKYKKLYTKFWMGTSPGWTSSSLNRAFGQRARASSSPIFKSSKRAEPAQAQILKISNEPSRAQALFFPRLASRAHDKACKPSFFSQHCIYLINYDILSNNIISMQKSIIFVQKNIIYFQKSIIY